MTLIEALILGLVQGLTEFLPVSSSGHLVLSQELMGVEDPGITFEILVHFATLLSVIIYFWKKLWQLFLAILPPARQSSFLSETIEAIEADLKRVRADILVRTRAGESAFQVAMARGVRYAIQARLRMLRELEASLAHQSQFDPAAVVFPQRSQ